MLTAKVAALGTPRASRRLIEILASTGRSGLRPPQGRADAGEERRDATQPRRRPPARRPFKANRAPPATAKCIRRGSWRKNAGSGRLATGRTPPTTARERLCSHDFNHLLCGLKIRKQKPCLRPRHRIPARSMYRQRRFGASRFGPATTNDSHSPPQTEIPKPIVRKKAGDALARLAPERISHDGKRRSRSAPRPRPEDGDRAAQYLARL
jgi:hypothetical protein